MPGGLYVRVTARGFPSQVAAGYTGEGALESQGGPADPAHGIPGGGIPTSTMTGFQPDPAAAPDVVILEGTWGLPGEAADPDQTPGYGPGEFRTHAAPYPGHAGSYYPSDELDALHHNSREIHAEDFGHPRASDAPPVGGATLPMDPWSANTPGEATGLAPLEGPQRVLGGMDAVQGYDLRNRYGFDAGHRHRQEVSGNIVNAYLDPAERPFIVPQASGSYIPTDAVQGPGLWASYLDAGNVNPDEPSAYAPPAEPGTLAYPLTEAVASSGWGP